MLDNLQWLFAPLDSFYISSGMAAVVGLVQSSNLIFWYLVLVFVRYNLPDIAIWIGYMINPRSFEPPPLKKFAASKPLVSVLIAGRNPGYSIVTCIRSVLESHYENVEVIFADDHSTDNSVELARAFESTGKVRVCANANHSGKPANLNVALMLARGEFLFVLDADSQLFPDTIDNILPYFEDDRVGGVSPSILVRNTQASILTRFQRIEYVFTYTLNQVWRDKLGLIAILSGMGTMFRTSAVRGLGGYDMGLGDDTDMTIRLRKTHWRLRTSLRGQISTDVPVTLSHLMRQRSRWTRNMVKMRLRKHLDMATGRYGFRNTIMFYEEVLNRTVHPLMVVALLIWVHATRGLNSALIVGGLYWFTTLFTGVKFLVGHDMTRGEPSGRVAWLIPFYLFYRIPLLINQVTQVTRELLQISPWHPYVPRRIWDQIPHH
jgi:cellulose synthase/poly-beta-1,6-N-acetylglucosamine synthase-like glycosyltransferase